MNPRAVFNFFSNPKYRENWKGRVVQIALGLLSLSLLLFLLGLISPLLNSFLPHKPGTFLQKLLWVSASISIALLPFSPRLPCYPWYIGDAMEVWLEKTRFNQIVGLRNKPGINWIKPVNYLVKIGSRDTFHITTIQLGEIIVIKSRDISGEPQLATLDLTALVPWKFNPLVAEQAIEKKEEILRQLELFNPSSLSEWVFPAVKRKIQTVLAEMTVYEAIAPRGRETICSDIEQTIGEMFGSMGVCLFHKGTCLEIRFPPQVQAAYNDLWEAESRAAAKIQTGRQAIQAAFELGVDPSAYAYVHMIVSGDNYFVLPRSGQKVTPFLQPPERARFLPAPNEEQSDENIIDGEYHERPFFPDDPS